MPNTEAARLRNIVLSGATARRSKIIDMPAPISGDRERILGAIVLAMSEARRTGQNGTSICPLCDGFVRWSTSPRPNGRGFLIAGHCVTTGDWAFSC